MVDSPRSRVTVVIAAEAAAVREKAGGVLSELRIREGFGICAVQAAEFDLLGIEGTRAAALARGISVLRVDLAPEFSE